MRTKRLHLEQLENRCVPTQFLWSGSRFFNNNWSTAANWYDSSGNVATRSPGSDVGDLVLIDNQYGNNPCILDATPANALTGFTLLGEMLWMKADLHIAGDSFLSNGPLNASISAISGSPTLWLEGGTFTWSGGALGWSNAIAGVHATINVDGGTLTCSLTTPDYLGFGINVGTGTNVGTLNLNNTATITAKAFGAAWPTAAQVVVGLAGTVNVTASNANGFIPAAGATTGTLESVGVINVSPSVQYGYLQPLHMYSGGSLLSLGQGSVFTLAGYTGQDGTSTGTRGKSLFMGDTGDNDTIVLQDGATLRAFGKYELFTPRTSDR